MDAAVKVDLDYSDLRRAVAIAFKYSESRGPEKILAHTAFFVAVKAQKLTPYVEQSTIDTELGTIVTPRASAKATSSRSSSIV